MAAKPAFVGGAGKAVELVGGVIFASGIRPLPAQNHISKQTITSIISPAQRRRTDFDDLDFSFIFDSF